MPAARLLDLTRSLRRTGRVCTGVDRVERAYLDRFLQDRDVPAFGVVRTPFGYLLLDRDGLAAFRSRLNGSLAVGRVGAFARMALRQKQPQVQARTDARRHALARCLPGGLARMLRKHLPPDFDYYNTGHSNLSERMFTSVTSASGSIHVLIHDVIPIDHPDFQRPGTTLPFRDKMKRVQDHADRIIYNSADTRKRAEAVMQEWGRVPEGIVSHLGAIRPVPVKSELPDGLPPARPYFVTVGTIEPRKNHAFLLDIWARLGPNAPPLLICGNRGWNNDAVFTRLDDLPPDGPVKEVPNLSDGALAALVAGSAGSLFPSHAEGFGFPPLEALQLGTRVLCNDLTVLREIIGAHGTFAPVSDVELWLKTIQSWENTPPNTSNETVFAGPNWEDHFKTVLSLR